MNALPAMLVVELQIATVELSTLPGQAYMWIASAPISASAADQSSPNRSA
jgi:hypothetical protein